MNAARKAAEGRRRARLKHEHAAGAHRRLLIPACPHCTGWPSALARPDEHAPDNDNRKDG